MSKLVSFFLVGVVLGLEVLDSKVVEVLVSDVFVVLVSEEDEVVLGSEVLVVLVVLGSEVVVLGSEVVVVVCVLVKVGVGRISFKGLTVPSPFLQPNLFPTFALAA